MSDCPFCNIPDERVILGNESVIAFLDLYPVNPGHTLVIPRRHVASFFDLTSKEQEHAMALIGYIRQMYKLQGAIGFNVGINDGEAAGQTVMHAHWHIIPRYRNDQPDPRGGVRWVFPDKAKYW